MGVELLTPSRAGVREEDIDMIGCLRHFSDEALNFGDFCGIGGDGYGAGIGVLVWQSVEGGAGGVAGGGFAGGDVDFGAPDLKETGHDSADRQWEIGQGNL